MLGISAGSPTSRAPYPGIDITTSLVVLGLLHLKREPFASPETEPVGQGPGGGLVWDLFAFGGLGSVYPQYKGGHVHYLAASKDTRWRCDMKHVSSALC